MDGLPSWGDAHPYFHSLDVIFLSGVSVGVFSRSSFVEFLDPSIKGLTVDVQDSCRLFLHAPDLFQHMVDVIEVVGFEGHKLVELRKTAREAWKCLRLGSAHRG